jgi:hypothetical protein
MNYKLSRKNKDNKWWTYGNFKKSEQYGTYSAGFKISDLEAAILEEKNKGNEWINFSAFEDTPKEDKQKAFDQAKEELVDPLEDDIPFAIMLPLLSTLIAISSYGFLV